MVIPESLEMREPVSHRSESRGLEVIASLAAVSLLGHETGVEQDPQVLRNGRATHLKLACDRVDGAIGIDEQIKHPSPRRMANRSKNIVFARGSNHAATICKTLLTRQVEMNDLRK